MYFINDHYHIFFVYILVTGYSTIQFLLTLFPLNAMMHNVL